MNSGDCDCGTCCNTCGHATDCIRNDLEPVDDSYDRDAYEIG